MNKNKIRNIPVWLVTTSGEDLAVMLSLRAAEAYVRVFEKRAKVACEIEEGEAILKFPNGRKVVPRSA
jgi:hypothetical protein